MGPEEEHVLSSKKLLEWLARCPDLRGSHALHQISSYASELKPFPDGLVIDAKFEIYGTIDRSRIARGKEGHYFKRLRSTPGAVEYGYYEGRPIDSSPSEHRMLEVVSAIYGYDRKINKFKWNEERARRGPTAEQRASTGRWVEKQARAARQANKSTIDRLNTQGLSKPARELGRLLFCSWLRERVYQLLAIPLEVAVRDKTSLPIALVALLKSDCSPEVGANARDFISTTHSFCNYNSCSFDIIVDAYSGWHRGSSRLDPRTVEEDPGGWEGMGECSVKELQSDDSGHGRLGNLVEVQPAPPPQTECRIRNSTPGGDRQNGPLPAIKSLVDVSVGCNIEYAKESSIIVPGTRDVGVQTDRLPEVSCPSTLHCRSNGADSSREIRDVPNGISRGPIVGKPQLHKNWSEKPVALAKIQKPAQLGHKAMEGGRRRMLERGGQMGPRSDGPNNQRSTRVATEGSQHHQGPEGANTGRRLSKPAANDNNRRVRMDRGNAILAAGNAQKLRTQRATSVSRQGDNSNTSDGLWSIVASKRKRRRHRRTAGTSSSNSQSPRVSGQISPTEEKKIVSEVSKKFTGRTLIFSRLADQSICEVREVENHGEGRRPKDDTGKVAKVQRRVRFVHEGSREESLPLNGPRTSPPRHRNTVNSQGNESKNKSSSITNNLGTNTKPSKCELRPVKVGQTCVCGTNGGNAPMVSPTPPVRMVEVPIVQTGVQQMHNREGADQVQRHRRGHVWRHDDSTGKLCCSDCDTTNLSRSNKAACHRNRRCQVRRMQRSGTGYTQPDRGPAYFCQTYPARVVGGNNKAQGMVSSPGRRGRPRVDNVETPRTSYVKDAGNMVASNGPQPEDRGDNRQIPHDRVLPAQAPLDRASPKLGNDAKPMEGNTNQLSDKFSQYSPSQGIFEDSMVCKSVSARGHAPSRPPVLQVGQLNIGTFVGPEALGEDCVRLRLPTTSVARVQGEKGFDASPLEPTSVDQEITCCNADSRIQSDGVGAVGSNPDGAGDSRENGSKTAEESNPADVGNCCKGGSGFEVHPLPSHIESAHSYSPRIQLVHGDILSLRKGAILHLIGDDCTMGAGFAKSLIKTGRVDRLMVIKGLEKNPPATKLCPVSKIAVTVDKKNLAVTFIHCVTKAKSSVPAIKQVEVDLKHKIPYRRYYAEKLKPALLRGFAAAKHKGYKEVHIPYLIGCGLDKADETLTIQSIFCAAVEADIKVYAWRLSKQG